MVFWPLLKQNQTAKKPQPVKYAAVLLMSVSFSAFPQEVDISGT
ncbi:MAG: hypothetical protein ACJAS1_006959, partial [Oleiphilaceae bacterium]